ncbi:C39 family peptidase [Paraburkholderia sp.]|jgi:hypothetical protein|uniref:C39 family peptidase n=1 Tax=Paraburkholderia sp. TaxID=1926495 RepID=UPI002F3EF1B8
MTATKNHTVRHTGVPYYSQWGSPQWVRAIVEDDADPCADPTWQRTGFTEPDHYRFWAPRLCGLTCLESALDFWDIGHAPRACLLDEALRHEVYRMREDGGVDGLIYRPFAGWAQSAFGLQVEVLPEVGLEEIAGRIDADTLAIISVSPEIRRPDEPNAQRGGHLILLHGRDRDGIWFHNPSGVAPYQADVYLPFATVERFYAGRGMTLRRASR